MESFGRYLRNEREQRNVSIEDISRATKISEGQLRALEADDLAALPTTAYIKGFIRAYSKHLGIDPNDALLRFESYLQEIEQDEGGISQDFPSTGFRKDTPNIGLVVAAGGIILLIIVILMILIRACGNRSHESRNDPPNVLIQAQKSPGPTAGGLSKPASLPEGKLSGEVRESAAQEEGEKVVMPLPVVPPDAFRITQTAPPLVNPPGAKSAAADVLKNPNGGGSSNKRKGDLMVAPAAR